MVWVRSSIARGGAGSRCAAACNNRSGGSIWAARIGTAQCSGRPPPAEVQHRTAQRNTA